MDGDELDPILSVDNLRLKGEFKNTYAFSAVVGTGGGIYYYYTSDARGSETEPADEVVSRNFTTHFSPYRAE